jgi:tRNA threonylcarbamoyladenosine biosynthesis protein TsaE
MAVACCAGVTRTFQSRSVAQTEAIAAQLALELRGGESIALYGDLGAGKTQFVRGIVAALGGDRHAVSSPTFVLLNVYSTPRMPVFHLDAYRLHESEELESIGYSELLSQGGVVIVEWAERVVPLLPEDHLSVRISATGKRSRKIEVDCVR